VKRGFARALSLSLALAPTPHPTQQRIRRKPHRSSVMDAGFRYRPMFKQHYPAPPHVPSTHIARLPGADTWIRKESVHNVCATFPSRKGERDIAVLQGAERATSAMKNGVNAPTHPPLGVHICARSEEGCERRLRDLWSTPTSQRCPSPVPCKKERKCNRCANS